MDSPKMGHVAHPINIFGNNAQSSILHESQTSVTLYTTSRQKQMQKPLQTTRHFCGTQHVRLIEPKVGGLTKLHKI